MPALDAVCVLNKGFAMNLWDVNGSFSAYSPETQKMITGWQWFDSPEYALLWLLEWLHATMPRFAIRSSPLLPYLLPVLPGRLVRRRRRNQRKCPGTRSPKCGHGRRHSGFLVFGLESTFTIDAAAPYLRPLQVGLCTRALGRSGCLKRTRERKRSLSQRL